MPWLEILIIVFIFTGIALVLWKGGAANPVGTGQLQRKIGNLQNEMRSVAGDVGRATEKIKALETHGASKQDVETLRDELRADRRRVEQVFVMIQHVEQDLGKLRESHAAKHVVVEAMAESIRTLSTDLADHRRNVDEKLAHLDGLSELTDANRRAIESLVAQLPTLRDRQAEIAARQAETATDVKHVMAQVDRLYNFLTEKALK